MTASDSSDLFLRHKNSLVAYAKSKGASEADADEIVQEAFMRLQKYGQKEKIQSDVAFLRTIIVNIIRDRFRRLKITPFVENYDEVSFAIASPAPDQEKALAAKQDLEATIRDIRDLPDITGEVLIRYRLQGETYERIAQNMGLTIALVRRHLRDALVMLAKKRGERI
ncbi:MAG: RNA polymerase sigma factor [Pseudomonadota bacterium]